MVTNNPVTYEPLKIVYILDACICHGYLIFSYNDFLIPSTHEEKFVSLVLTDGMHIRKEKSSMGLNNFYN